MDEVVENGIGSSSGTISSCGGILSLDVVVEVVDRRGHFGNIRLGLVVGNL